MAPDSAAAAPVVYITTAYDEIELVFTDDALWEIADKALERQTGARGLRSIIEGALLEVMSTSSPKSRHSRSGRYGRAARITRRCLRRPVLLWAGADCVGSAQLPPGVKA